MGQLTKARLGIVGTVPPPYGGVSVHISRMRDLLEKHGIDSTLYEQTGKSAREERVMPLGRSGFGIIRLLLTFPEDVIHFHFNGRAALALTGKLMRLRKHKRYLITIHSERPLRVLGSSGVLSRYMADCLQNAHHLICVSHKIAHFMIYDLHVDPLRVSVIPAFLKPSKQELDESNIPTLVKMFLGRHKKIVGSHGWFGYFVNGEHVYGFDHIARLASEIASRDPEIGMYTVISGCYEQRHREDILRLNERLSDHWMIIETPFSCAALYKRTNLFVRPTVTDGDSVSIRECLSLGVPVLASDAVLRPLGCCMFPVRDYSKMSDAFWKLMSEHSFGRENMGTSDGIQHGVALLEVIGRALKS